MRIYAIGDLHLSGSQHKPMDIFGEHWDQHQLKIERGWVSVVGEDDIVLIPGDISWAMTIDQMQPDLEWLHSLPGRKIFVRGNHDYWWKRITYLNTLYDDLFFVQNNAVAYDNYSFCGSRGWTCPGSANFTSQDLKIYKRELLRLELSLQSGRKYASSEIIAMLHYPPVNENKESSGFTDLFEKYGVAKVVYGHLHDCKSFNNALIGKYNGVDYQLVSADYIRFNPMRVR